MTEKSPYMDSIPTIIKPIAYKGIDIDTTKKVISLLQKSLLTANINIPDLQQLSNLLEISSRKNPISNGIRIPLCDIGDVNSIKDVLTKMKAQHTIGTNGDIEVIILSDELISKLRQRIIQTTKAKISGIIMDKTYNPVVRAQVDSMRNQLSLLGVTKKELDELEIQ